MRKNIFTTILLTLIFVFTTNGQSFSQLEKLSNELRTQSEDLVSRTKREIRKDKPKSAKEIQKAFLAEQFRASAQLIGRMIGARYNASEIRYAGMMLADLSRKFPDQGENSFEWQKARDTVEELSRELRGLKTSVVFTKAGYEVDRSNIIGRAVWSGTVDKDVQLTVRGDKITSKTVSGLRYPEGLYSISSNLPARDRIRVGVRIRTGRGKAHVVQQPKYENGYTAIVQIRDEPHSARNYSVEIYWYKR